MTLHPAVDNDECLLNASQTRHFFGGVSQMWLSRRKRNDAAFPKPRFIAGRQYFVLGELKQYRDSRPRFNVVNNDQFPPPRKQQT